MLQTNINIMVDIIEKAAVCSFVVRQFSPKTFVALIELGQNPTPEYQLMNQKLDEFKDYIDALPIQIKRELFVMNLIGRGDYTLEQWDEVMEWCKTLEMTEKDVKEPEYSLFNSKHVLPLNLTRFLFKSLLNPE